MNIYKLTRDDTLDEQYRNTCDLLSEVEGVMGPRKETRRQLEEAYAKRDRNKITLIYACVAIKESLLSR